MSERRKFKVGDVVRMKSGSRKMTIIEWCAFDDEEYEVQWFEGRSICTDTVNENAIERA